MFLQYNYNKNELFIQFYITNYFIDSDQYCEINKGDVKAQKTLSDE